MSETTVPSPVPRVDARAARLSQALVAALVALALLLRAPALLAVAGIHLALAAALGPRGDVAIRVFDAASTGTCVGCWLYGYLGPFRGLVRWIG